MLVVFGVYLVMGLGFGCSGWVVLACSLGVLMSQMSFSYGLYFLSAEWFGMDDMSSLMVVLSVLVLMVSLVSSVKDMKVKKNVFMTKGFTAVELVVLISLGSVVFFSVSSWMDFYFFFEFALIPTFFLIMKWGYQPERLQAGLYMMMYTVSASLPMLVGLLSFWSMVGSDSMLLSKMISGASFYSCGWFWVFLCLGFLVKLPIYSVHGWLPKAHVEAPLSGSMLLAGILLKFGGYGIIRIIWLLENSLTKVILFLIVFSLWGGLMSSCICICQSDLKSFIAYSSVGHMAMSLGGALSFYSLGKVSCVCLFFAHGVCSPMLFSLAASVYDFTSSRNILVGKGILRVFPAFSVFWFVLCAVNMGFPPSINFFSEVFCVSSMIWLSYVLSLSAGGMCFMAGCYCLVLYSLVNHGPLSVFAYSYSVISSRYLLCLAFSTSLLMLMFLCLDYSFV